MKYKIVNAKVDGIIKKPSGEKIIGEKVNKNHLVKSKESMKFKKKKS